MFKLTWKTNNKTNKKINKINLIIVSYFYI